MAGGAWTGDLDVDVPEVARMMESDGRLDGCSPWSEPMLGRAANVALPAKGSGRLEMKS